MWWWRGLWSGIYWSVRGYKDDALLEKIVHDLWPPFHRHHPDIAYEAFVRRFTTTYQRKLEERNHDDVTPRSKE